MHSKNLFYSGKLILFANLLMNNTAELANLLKLAALNPHAEVRRPAEAKILSFYTQQGFSSQLYVSSSHFPTPHFTFSRTSSKAQMIL